MAKTTTGDQHLVLHRYWLRDCCLCKHEETIKELQEKVKQLEKELISYKIK